MKISSESILLLFFVLLTRRMTWESHNYLIDRHNRKADDNIHTFRLAMNEYGDLVSIFHCFQPHTNCTVSYN